MVKVTELIEMGDKNVFNTTGSKLWQKIVLLFDAELKTQYSLMRQDRFTVDNIMKYLYDEQISQIPAYYYNKDMQSKYLNFGSSYLYALHGSGEQHIRKWIRERLMYVDTLLGYRTSSSDYITLRSSKLGEVYLDIETYIPMYVSVKWRDEANNTGLQTKRVGRGEKVRFTYNMPTATDQEIIIYAGHYLKRLGDVSNLQPTSMLIANADRLTEIECHSPNLINTDLSECTKLQRIDLSDCTALGTGIGAQPILNIQNCKYLRYCNCMNTQLTAIYTMQAGGNLEEIYYPETTQVVQLTNQTYLHTVGIPYGYQSSVVSEYKLDSNNKPVYTAYVESGKTYRLRLEKYPSSGGVYVWAWGYKPNSTNGVKIFSTSSSYTTLSSSKPYADITIPDGVNRIEINFNEGVTIKPYLLSNVEEEFVYCENLANVQISNCNAIEKLQYPYFEGDPINFDAFKYVQNLNITNSLSGLNSMQFNGFDKLRNVTLSSLKELDSIGFEDMMPVTTTSTLKNITISDCPLITSLSFSVSSDDYKVAFASNGKLDLGGLQSLKSIECNTSVKGLDTLIVPTSLTDLRFTTEYGDGINEIKNIWSASAVHNGDGFEGIDFQDMTIEFIDMLGLNGISNAINFHIAPKTQNPNLNTARDGSASKPWFHPIGSIDLSNYTGLMIGMLRGIDLNKLDVVINTDRDQTDLTSLFECATLPTAQNIVTKTNNILAKFPKSVIWDYMFKGCDLSFSPKDITIPNRGLSLKGMYKDSNVTEDVSLPNVVMAVDEMFMNCTGITTYEKNWLKTYAKLTFTVPTSNGTSGSWDDNGNYTEGTNYNQFLYTLSDGERAFKIMTTGTGVVRINYFYNASFMSRIVYTPESDSYPYVVTIPDGCNKVIFVCDKTIGFASEGTITTSNCYTNTGGALSEIPVSWGGYGLDKNVTSIYVIDTTHLTNTTTFNLVSLDNQAGITDWGDGVTNSEKSHTYAEHGVYTIKTKSWSNGTPSDDLKTALIEVKQIKLIGHNGNSKDYSNAFNGCSKLRKVTAYNLSPTDCSSMFSGCNSLTEIIGLNTWNMSNCNKVHQMFEWCTLLSSIEGINTWVTSKFEGLFRMFFGCKALTDISFINDWDLSNVRLASFTFTECVGLTGEVTLQLDMPKCTSLNSFLGKTNITSLNITGCNVPLVDNMNSFVGNCANLTSLIGTETLNMDSNLQNLATFAYNTKLTSLNLSGWDFTNVTNIGSALPSTLTTVTLNNVVDNRTERTSDNGLRGFLNTGGLKTIVMDEIAMTDFSNLFQGVTKIKNDIVFPSNATNVSNCFKGCTGMTHVHSNWNNEYEENTKSKKPTSIYSNSTSGSYEVVSPSNYIRVQVNRSTSSDNSVYPVIQVNGKDVSLYQYKIVSANDGTLVGGTVYQYSSDYIYIGENNSFTISFSESNARVDIYACPGVMMTTDCYSGCTGITHCDEVDLGVNEYTTGLDEVPYTWGGYEFTKGTTSILELVIPEDNYTFTLKKDNLLANFDAGQTSGYNIYNRVNWGDGTITKGEYSHTYEKAGTYILKGHYYMGQWEPTASIKETLIEIKQIPKYCRWMTSQRYLAKGCTKLKKVTINDYIGYDNEGGLSNAFNGCTALEEVYVKTTQQLTKGVSLQNAFQNCRSLKTVTIIGYKPTSCNSTFYGCSSLTEIIGMDTWDMSNCYSINNMFTECKVLGDNTFLTMSEWNVAKITGYYGTFQNCKAMTNINFMSSWNMSNCRELGTIFQGCTGLIEIDLSNRFLTGLNTIRYLCADCTNLQTINLTNLIDKDNYSGDLTQNTYSCENPFNNCTSLQNNPYLQIGIGLASISFWSLTCVPDILDLSEIDTSNLQSFRPTATATQIIGVNSNFPWGCSFRSTPGVTVIKDLYYKHSSYDYYYYNGAPAPNTFINFATREGSTAYKAENFGTLGTATCINNVLKLSSTNYNVNTFISLFNCLYDYTAEGGSANFTLTLGANNLARLTDEQIAIATNKGWTLQ